MVIEKEQLLDYLVDVYLQPSFVDEGYFKVFREIKRLEQQGIFVDIKEVQNKAYRIEEEVK